jgi:hypothetical protein
LRVIAEKITASQKYRFRQNSVEIKVARYQAQKNSGVTKISVSTFSNFNDQPSHGEMTTLPKSTYFGGESASWGGGGMVWVAILAAPSPPTPTQGILLFASFFLIK